MLYVNVAFADTFPSPCLHTCLDDAGPTAYAYLLAA